MSETTATEKKYLDAAGLSAYDAKIKTLINQKDGATLQSAKDYADGLAVNYDSSGSAASALQAAKEYADGKDAAIAAAQKAGDDAQAAAEAAQLAAATADGKAVAAQGEVDALEIYVGTFTPSDGVDTVVKYIDKKTEGIASNEALTTLAGRVTTAEGKIATAEGDITTLKQDMTAAEGKINTLVGTDAGKSVRTIANEELVAQLIPETAAESLDTLQEIAAWIQEHPGDASEMNKAIAALQTLVGTLPEGITATTVVGYVAELVAAEQERAEGVETGLDGRLDAVEAKLGSGTGSVADMIATAKSEAISTAAEDAIAKANKALADAKEYTNGEISTVNGAIALKADQSGLDAVSGKVTAAEGKITTLEGKAHTHGNKDVLDGITTQLIANWNDASSKAHEHENKTVLDGITSAKVTAWDNAEANAKAYTDAKIGEFTPITSDEIDAMFA